MHPTSFRPAAFRQPAFLISVVCLFAVLLALAGLAPAQAARVSSKLWRQALTGDASLKTGAASLKIRSAGRAGKVNAPPLTADNWTGLAGDSNWGTANNWDGGIPTSGSAVTISTLAANVNVNVAGSFGTLTLGSGDTLTVAQRVLLNAYGNIVNNGSLVLNASEFSSQLELQGNVTLSGSGTLTLSNNTQNYVFGAAGADTLTNQQTIQGAGQIGFGAMSLVNSGTINANQSAGMTIDASGTGSTGMTNTGLVEATGGMLTLSSTTVNNAGGTFSANGQILSLVNSTINGGNVTLTGAATLQLNNATVGGGAVLTNSSAGTIEVVGLGTLGAGTINNSAGGILKIDQRATLDLQGGAYTQLGAVQLNASEFGSVLTLEGNVTLSGGSVTLSNNTQNYIEGAAGSDTLTNAETIQGAGQIGFGAMSLVNSGTINANQSAGMTINASGTGSTGMTNTGLVEATGGTLTLSSTTVNNTGGTFSANGQILSLVNSTISGGNVTLPGAATLQLNNATVGGGAVLTNSSTGTIEVVGLGTLGAGTINNSAGGILKIDQRATLDLQGGTFSQLGTVQLNASEFGSVLTLEGNVTLSGGSVTLSNNTQNYIDGAAGSDTLTNAETIQGAGQIGFGTMSLVNSGTINANQSAGMTINASGTGSTGMTNTGLVEATGGTLTLSSTTVNNAGGTFSANGQILSLVNSTINGGNVTLTGAATLQLNNATLGTGSVLTNSSTGTIEVVGLGTLGAGTINNSAGGILKIDQRGTLDLQGGTYTQLGAVQLNASEFGSVLTLEGSATLSGGTVTMTNNTGNLINAAVSTDILTNQETISGAGDIGFGEMGLVNSGTILSNGSSNLIIDVSSSNFNNTGTIEAAGGTLTIEGPGTTFFSNDNQTTNTLTGGTYIANGNNIQWAAGAGAIKTLAANVTEENGGQLIDTNAGNVNMLAGLTSITPAGSLTIGGVTFSDAGSFSNAGSLTILSGESFTVGTLSQISGSSLTAGTFVLDGNLSLSGATQTITTNAANLTLAGGTIENANSTNALAGLATNSGSLTIGGASNNVSTTAASFNNTGTLTINAGDSFTVAKLAQISGSTLSGGTFVLGGNLDLTTAGINITTNAATLTLEGGTINSNNVNALSALAANTKSLTIAGTGYNYSPSAASFSNTGTLTINATDSMTIAALTQLTGANNSKTLSAGTYVLAGNLDLTAAGISITKNAANLTLEGGTINSNNVNTLAALAANTGKLTVAGTGINVSTSVASFSNTGTLTIDAGDSFTAAKLTQITGATLSGGTFVLTGNLDLNTAANITTNAAAVTLEGGTIQTGSTNDLANLSSNTGSLTLAGNAGFTTVGSFSNSGALTVNKGSTFTVGAGTLTNLSGGVLASGTYIIGGTLKLPTANGGITTNAANLTLTGTAARITNGTANALASFNNNTGTFALAGGAAFTTATTGNFSNAGTVNVAKGTKLTVGGTNHNYNQTAGTTTVDGTIAATSVTVTGGSILGAGTIQGKTSIGNATGTAATINVGDTGKAGLLAITGTYTQLATGTMTGLINGTTAGSGFSQMNVTGTAALAGTLNFSVASGFQSSLTVGETFTVLNASAVTGTFTNSTIAINSSLHFTVSYTSTGVVLTVASGPVSGKNSTSYQPAAVAANTTKPVPAAKSRSGAVLSGLQRGIGERSARATLVAGLPQPSSRSFAIAGRGYNWPQVQPSWKFGSVIPPSLIHPSAVSPLRAMEAQSSRITSNSSNGVTRGTVARSPLTIGNGAGSQRIAVKPLPVISHLAR